MIVETPFEYESNHCFVFGTAEVELTEAEPMIRYYSDGSGHPGAPAEAEIVNIEVDCYTCYRSDRVLMGVELIDFERRLLGLIVKHQIGERIIEDATELAAER